MTTKTPPTDEQPAITHGEVAANHPTAEPDFLAPNQVQAMLGEDPVEQVALLREWLEANFPGEMVRTNVQRPETAVEVAIRLLTGLSATVPPSQVDRCPEEYCNRPRHHAEPHGWIHYQ